MNHLTYKSLCKEVWEHNKRYYVDHAPTISDEEFDALLKKIEAAELEHPEWVTPSSPTQRVGETLTEGFQSVTHSVPMLSLSNTYSRKEVEDFFKRVDRLIEGKEAAYCCEMKLDGTAVSLRYEKGEFVRGVTRGDGKKGDEITQNLRTIQSLPLHLLGSDVPDWVEIRGEVMMPKEAFSELNKEKEVDGEAPFANPRNAAAGSLKLLDPSEVFGRKLIIFCYALAESSEVMPESQFQSFKMMQKWGLPTAGDVALCSTVDEIFTFAGKLEKKRPKLPFEIDGVVIKLDSISDQLDLGGNGEESKMGCGL